MATSWWNPLQDNTRRSINQVRPHRASGGIGTAEPESSIPQTPMGGNPLLKNVGRSINQFRSQRDVGNTLAESSSSPPLNNDGENLDSVPTITGQQPQTQPEPVPEATNTSVSPTNIPADDNIATTMGDTTIPETKPDRQADFLEDIDRGIARIDDYASGDSQVDRTIANRQWNQFQTTSAMNQLSQAQRIAQNPNLTEGAKQAAVAELNRQIGIDGSNLAGQLAQQSQERAFSAAKTYNEDTINKHLHLARLDKNEAELARWEQELFKFQDARSDRMAQLAYQSIVNLKNKPEHHGLEGQDLVNAIRQDPLAMNNIREYYKARTLDDGEPSEEWINAFITNHALTPSEEDIQTIRNSLLDIGMPPDQLDILMQSLGRLEMGMTMIDGRPVIGYSETRNTGWVIDPDTHELSHVNLETGEPVSYEISDDPDGIKDTTIPDGKTQGDLFFEDGKAFKVGPDGKAQSYTYTGGDPLSSRNINDVKSIISAGRDGNPYYDAVVGDLGDLSMNEINNTRTAKYLSELHEIDPNILTDAGLMFDSSVPELKISNPGGGSKNLTRADETSQRWVDENIGKMFEFNGELVQMSGWSRSADHYHIEYRKPDGTVDKITTRLDRKQSGTFDFSGDQNIEDSGSGFYINRIRIW